jgi:leucyl/phenylalanyl-tRNA--protein transferase
MTAAPDLPFLAATDPPERLPDPASALTEPEGLLAVGGALTPDWLIAAYRRGIFPWFGPGEPILWWSPNPRAVFEPSAFTVSRSLRQSARHRGYVVRMDTAFARVVAACAEPRGASGTWITPEMKAAYQRLYEHGIAHSVETWRDQHLVGGLYGVQLGGVFFGESMFTRERDASKVALWALMQTALAVGIALVDCQMMTPHLERLGAVAMPRARFLARLAPLVLAPIGKLSPEALRWHLKAEK